MITNNYDSRQGEKLFERLQNVKPVGRNSWRADCPCKPHSQSQTLSISIGDKGFYLYKCHAGCDWQDIKRVIGGCDFKPAPHWVSPNPRIDSDRLSSYQKWNQQIITQSVPVSLGDPAHTYLKKRGLECELTEDVRYHPSLPLYDGGETKGWLPTMVLVLRDTDGAIVGLQYVYLLPNSKPIRKIKQVIYPGATRGAVVRLQEASDSVVLAEGSETALSLGLIIRQPSWSCVSAGGLETVKLPKEIKTVYIGVDHDKDGIKAATALGARLIAEDREAILCFAAETPEQLAIKGYDWNDHLRDLRGIAR